MSNAVLGLRLKQQLTLTPRLQQSVKLLQLSALECVQELHQAIAQNPFLEEGTEPAESTQAEDSAAEDSGHADLDFSGSGSAGGDDTPDWTEWTASPSTLHDSLREQLLLLGLTERDYVLANLIIDALDEDGFLRQPLEEFAAQAPGAEPGELETALRIVQTLEPNGIAARDLGECLFLQLQALERGLPGRELALDIVQNKLALMAARYNTRLLEAFGCSEDDLRVAMELIRSLDPRPGSKVGTFEPGQPEGEHRQRVAQVGGAPQHRAVERTQLRVRVVADLTTRDCLEAGADLRERALRLDVAGDDEHRVVRRIPAVVEGFDLLAGQAVERGFRSDPVVCVAGAGEGERTYLTVKTAAGGRLVARDLLLDRAALELPFALRAAQIVHAIGFDAQHGIEIGGGDGEAIRCRHIAGLRVERTAECGGDRPQLSGR